MFTALKFNYTAFLVLLACTTLAACGKSNTEDLSTSDNNPLRTTGADIATTTVAATRTMSIEELRTRARNAFQEQRLHSPAGNNALEYYLAIRNKTSSHDALAENALVDLTPYTVIAAEQAIARSDFKDAIRLRDLITQVDANAPALSRISKEISDGIKHLEAMALIEEQRKRDLLLAVPQQAAIPQQNTQSSMPQEAPKKTTQVLATAIAPAFPSVSKNPEAVNQVAAAPITASAARTIASAPIVAKKKELVPIRTPDPAFPSEAYNRGVSGSVQVEFIVQADGGVSDVRILNSSQRTFDRNVLSTVKRWKFGPLDEPMTVRRSFNFDNPG